MERNVAFSRCDRPGLEHLRLIEQNEEIIADGLVISIEEDTPFRAHYIIHCDSAWCVRAITLDLFDNQAPPLQLQADGKGHWSTANGTPLPSFDGCIDVDITATPFTNTLPIRRLHLTPGLSAEITAVYFKLPELQFQPARQRYTCLNTSANGSVYIYEGLESGFTAKLQVDNDGLILDYPDLWKRI